MKRVIIIASVFIVLLGVVLAFAWYTKGSFTPWSAEDYQYDDVSDAEWDLKESGFTNIERIPVEVDFLEDGPWSKPVTEISIDGDTDFEAGQRYRFHAPVRIYYNCVRRMDTPIDSKDIQNYEPEALAQMFVDAGFTNVNVTEHYDLTGSFVHKSDDWDLFEYYRTHGATPPPYFNEVMIDGSTHFEFGELLPISVPIEIDAHYQPNIHIVFVEVTYQEPLEAVTDPVRIYKNGEPMPYWLFEYGEETSLVTGVDGDTGVLKLTFWREGSDWKSEELAYTVTEDMQINIMLDRDMRILQNEISAANPNRVKLHKPLLQEYYAESLTQDLEVTNEAS